MRMVERVETADGVLHATERDAKRHAEAAYGRALSKLAGEILRVEKYQAMHEFIDSRLAEFCTLSALRDDIKLEGED